VDWVKAITELIKPRWLGGPVNAETLKSLDKASAEQQPGVSHLEMAQVSPHKTERRSVCILDGRRLKFPNPSLTELVDAFLSDFEVSRNQPFPL
jgi:hypothetical protein